MSMETHGRQACCNRYQAPVIDPHIDTRTLASDARGEELPWEALPSGAWGTQLSAVEDTSLEAGRNTSCVGGTTAAEAGVPAHHLA